MSKSRLSAEPIHVNGNEVWGRVVERPGQLNVTLDYGDWRGLRLHIGQRLPIRRGELDDRWLYVARETPIPGESCLVEFAAKYDGPVEEPPPRARPERRLRPAAEERYEGHIITFPAVEDDPPPAAAAVLPFPGVKEAPPAPAVLAIDQGGAHAELLRAGERWLRMYKPQARFGVFVTDEGDDAPMTQVTIRSSDAASAG